MFGLLIAVALIVVLMLATTVVMRTLVSGIRGDEPPLRLLRPVSRRITAKVEMLDVDAQYRQLVSSK